MQKLNSEAPQPPPNTIQHRIPKVFTYLKAHEKTFPRTIILKRTLSRVLLLLLLFLLLLLLLLLIQ